jgi:hypothetical protein
MGDDLFRDFNEFSNGFLKLPINGRTYTIYPVGIRTGALLRRAAEQDAEALAELDAGEKFYRAVLGATYDELYADDVPEPAVDRAALTAMADFTQGRIAALKVWETGHSPKALAALVEAAAQIMLTP